MLLAGLIWPNKHWHMTLCTSASLPNLVLLMWTYITCIEFWLPACPATTTSPSPPFHVSRPPCNTITSPIGYLATLSRLRGLRLLVSSAMLPPISFVQCTPECECSREASQNAKPGTIKCMQFTFLIDQPTLISSANPISNCLLNYVKETTSQCGHQATHALVVGDKSYDATSTDLVAIKDHFALHGSHKCKSLFFRSSAHSNFLLSSQPILVLQHFSQHLCLCSFWWTMTKV